MSLTFYECKSLTTKPQLLVIIMHGYGGNGAVFLQMAQYWSTNYIPQAHILCPNGPYQYEGHTDQDARQWFSLSSEEGDFLKNEVNKVLPILNGFIEEQRKRLNLEHDQIVLSGFSQGAMLSLYAGLYGENQPLGIIGYSGWLNQEQDKILKNKPNVLLVHGNRDDVVPFQYHKQTKEFLKSQNIAVESFIEDGVDHQITIAGIERGGEFIKKLSLERIKLKLKH